MSAEPPEENYSGGFYLLIIYIYMEGQMHSAKQLLLSATLNPISPFNKGGLRGILPC